MKPAGGIRTAKQALHCSSSSRRRSATRWLTPDLFRFGASTLLNDVLMQLARSERPYQSGDYSRTTD